MRLIIKWLGYTAGSWWLAWNYLDITGLKSISDAGGWALLIWYILLLGPIILFIPALAESCTKEDSLNE